MRAEVAAVTDGAGGLTWYGTIVACGRGGRGRERGAAAARGVDWLLAGVAACYVLALVPTVVVAGRSPVPRRPAPARRGPRPRAVRVSSTTVTGFALMPVSSGPTLLAVALAAEMHGRRSVGLAAAAFTVGSLAAPLLVSRLQARLHQPRCGCAARSAWWPAGCSPRCRRLAVRGPGRVRAVHDDPRGPAGRHGARRRPDR